MATKATVNKHQLTQLSNLLSFDRSFLEGSLSIPAGEFFQAPEGIIGIDEAGRGCLAGPVVAAAVQLPSIDLNSRVATRLSKLDDSKRLSAGLREELAQTIMAIAKYAICQASVEEIDELNILQASLLAMKRACMSIASTIPSLVLVDGNKSLPGLNQLQVAVVKGDCLSASIAAASILAKVYRDRLMCQLSAICPQYDWDKNKGYPSQQHRLVIASIGLSAWHRRSFAPCKNHLP
ncbi:MAG: ribonuclease HII [Candidatus Melainabacteria bacterium]|nr:ribonuclease HII [Candidatus Melainabacteria bacterium]